MKTIRFIYKPNEQMMQMINSEIVDYGNDFLYGIMDEQDKYMLKKRAIYLMCEEEPRYGKMIYKNPLAVVAKNQSDAARIYFEWTGANSSCMCELEQYANKAKVQSPTVIDM